MKMSDLQRKDVVNTSDGKIIGRIIDVEINNETGIIEDIIIEKSRYLRSLFSADTLMNIKYKDIKKIGYDVVLIEL